MNRDLALINRVQGGVEFTIGLVLLMAVWGLTHPGLLGIEFMDRTSTAGSVIFWGGTGLFLFLGVHGLARMVSGRALVWWLVGLAE